MNFQKGFYYILYEKPVKTHVVDLYYFESRQDIDDEIAQLNITWPNTKFIVARVVQGELTHLDKGDKVIIS